jgi:hypothetical protein
VKVLEQFLRNSKPYKYNGVKLMTKTWGYKYNGVKLMTKTWGYKYNGES